MLRKMQREYVGRSVADVLRECRVRSCPSAVPHQTSRALVHLTCWGTWGTNKKLLLHNIRIVRLYTGGVYKSCSKINKINRSLHDIQILNHLLNYIKPPPDPLSGKQSFWDSPGLQADRALIEDSFVEPSQKARFLASLAPRSGDWLL